MSFLIKLENNIPTGNAVDELNFRMLFPKTSFPSLLTSEVVEPFCFGMYDFSSQPNLERYEKAIEATPIKNEFGVFIQSWDIVSMSDEEKSKVDYLNSNMVRRERNYKLMECDWTQLQDAPVNSQDWVSYRNALRELPSQVGFPWDIIWPLKPE
jgi:hypothetical protein